MSPDAGMPQGGGYPTYDPQTGQPYSQTTGTSLIESQESKLIEWILNPDSIIRQLENTLKGTITESVWDEKLDDYKDRVVQENKPMMNNVGIKEVMRLIRIYVSNPVFSTTNYEEQTVSETTLVFAEEFIVLTLLCSNQWDLSFENRGMLINIMGDIVHAALLRSKGGHLIDYITQSYSEKYISSSGMGNQPRKRGMFGKIFGAYA
ncbi:hypothetical protein LCGC14_0534830 [marine sediment metagenome]|uniref:Uncharacterized protein n=1 Tax=marine sediment metagenome TaxID=412755 RepID=A0A0F9SD03_9ZZZZ